MICESYNKYFLSNTNFIFKYENLLLNTVEMLVLRIDINNIIQNVS